MAMRTSLSRTGFRKAAGRCEIVYKQSTIPSLFSSRRLRAIQGHCSLRVKMETIVPWKGTSHRYAKKALAVTYFGATKSPESSTSNAQWAHTCPTEIVHEERPVGDSNFNGSIERASQTIQGRIRATKDLTERQIGAAIGLGS